MLIYVSALDVGRRKILIICFWATTFLRLFGAYLWNGSKYTQWICYICLITLCSLAIREAFSKLFFTTYLVSLCVGLFERKGTVTFFSEKM